MQDQGISRQNILLWLAWLSQINKKVIGIHQFEEASNLEKAEGILQEVETFVLVLNCIKPTPWSAL
jgi:hypothetical protein